jgi:site-specific DNA recombinase
MNAPLRCALYARVSTERQAHAGTIESQISALEARIQADGLPLERVLRYLDNGSSGSRLHRPALDRLRDASAAGLLDRLYVLEPDRLARTYAHQWVLQEEFRAAGVEIIWVQHPPAATPEEELLVQIQGSVAQYERTKILERCRRGRRHAAQQGQLHALCVAPYGYRYVTKAEGDGQARYEIDLTEARVVRHIFAWVAEERCSTVEVVKRLAAAGIPTRTGKARWQRPTVHALLTNPAYRGEAAFGRTRSVPERAGQAGRSREPVPAEEWILLPVPPLVSSDLFAAAAARLADEQRRVQPATEGYLLTGLVRCGGCGTACVGRRTWKDRPSGRLAYRYYRCQGADRRRWGGERRCQYRGVPMEAVDAGVWQEVCRLLAEPDRVLTEYQRRLAGADCGTQHQELSEIERQLRQFARMRERLIELYTEDLITKAEVTTRLQRLEARLTQVREQREAVQHLLEQEADLRLVIGRLEDFAATVAQGLEAAPFSLRRHLITTLVKRVELEPETVRVVFRLAPGPAPPSSASLHFCTNRPTPATWHYVVVARLADTRQ